MNILELDSYNLDDAVKFNDHLNPRLWNADEHLKPEVRAQLLRIAEDFQEFLGVTDLDLEDITISGSNAAYTYTPNSDIDLHLVVKMPADEVYRELFDAKKFQYNEQHNITIGGYDVELYVQSADQPHISQGIYSIANNDWIQVPRRVKSVVDDTSTEHKFKTVGHQIEKAIASGSLKRMTRMAEKIKKMRQTGLESHGEFGPENLAFKMLRKQGLIKQLYDARNSAKDRELSLKEKAVVKTPVKYGFRTPVVVEIAPAEPAPAPSDEEILKDFIDFCFKELKLKQMPTIKLRRDPQWSVRNKTFGRYINDQHLLEVAWGHRHIMDVLRTVAHELTHTHQHERDGSRMGPDAGETGSPYENEANARAGILMRDYARLHPDYFAIGQAEDLKEAIDQELSNNDKLYLRILDNIKYRSRDYLTVRGAGGGRSFTLGILAFLKQLQQLGKENVVKFIQQSIAQADQEDRQTKGMSYGVLAQALVQLADQEKDKTFANAQREYNKQKQSVQQGIKEGVERNYLWHGSTQKIPVLTPQQAHDTGGAPGSNQNAIYATADKNTAIKMGMAERGSYTAMFDQADQLVLFSGRLRHGKNVYLHQLPRYDANGQDMWLPGGNGNEFYTKPEVKELKPLRIIPTPVDSHLSLVRKPTAKDLKLRKKYSKQGVEESASGYIPTYFAVGQAHGLTEDTTQNKIQGPFKVTDFDSATRTVSMENHANIVLDQSIQDQPHPGYNYAFQLEGNTASKIILLTADNVITTGKEILLIKRKGEPYAGYWALPGGFIEPGENPEQAARRELAEETGVHTTEPMKFIGKFTTPGRDPRMNDVWSFAYLATIAKESVQAGDDASQTKWVPIDQLARLNLAFDHAEIIEKSGIVNQQGVAESASGYIPTKKQAKDPRWSMALTKDIRPGQLGKEANKLNLKTDKQGIPQVANPNGLFEKLALELNQFKRKGTLAEAVEQLDEVKMSPSALMSWARSPEAQGIRAGFEAELIFRDVTNNGDSDYEMEPDYDADERCRSIQDIIDFFSGGDYGNLSPRQERALQEGLDEQYYEWYDEQMHKDFSAEAEDLIRKVLVDEGDWDLDNEIQKQLALLDLTDDEMNAIINAGERAPKFTSSKEQILYAEENPLYDKYLDAQNEAEGLLDDLVADEVSKQGANWDAALDDFRDNYQIDDDSGFFDDVGLRWMSDVASSYDLDWPYMTGGGGNDGSRDWESIGDSLHDTIDMPVKVSSGYHNATRKEGLWIVEPDTSLEPDDREDFGLEIVSPPMPLLTALEKLQDVCDWANDSSEGNAYTNSSTGLHMGVSVPFKGGDVDYLKLILFLGDEYVLRSFGREANTYCKSAMSKFKENIKGGRADPMGVIKLMQSGLLELAHREIQKGVGDGKYTSAHIQKGYIEFRSPGGDWLAEESADPEKLQSTMLRFARAMSLAANPAEERREYAKKLYKLVAPEGDSELALFSQFAAGELTAEQLKKRWAEKTIGTEKKMNQRWRLYQNVGGVWEPVPGAEWNGYPESEVKNKVWAKYGREALDSGEYQLVNMGEQDWEVYDVKTGVTLEIVKGKSKGEVADAVYDKYVDQGIGFQVRPWEDPATMTPRAKLAKRITSKKPEPIDYNYEIVNLSDVHLRVVDKFYADGKQEADKTFDKWLEIKGLPNDTHNYGYRPRKQEAAKEPAVQDTDINVAQNFEPTQVRASNGVPAWEIYERESGHVINTIFDHDQTSAWQQAQLYLRDIGAEQPNLFSLRPKMAQNFNQPPNATDRVGSWAIYDVTLGREISRMDNVPWQQASDRADELEQSTGHNMSVRGLSENITEGQHQHTEVIKRQIGNWLVYLDNHSVIRAMTRNIGPRMMTDLLSQLNAIPNLETQVPIGGTFWIQDNKTKSSFFFKRLDIPSEPLAVRCETGVKDDPRAGRNTPVFRVNAYTGPETPKDIQGMKQAKLISRFVGPNVMATNLAANIQKGHLNSNDAIRNPATQDSKRYDTAFKQAQQMDKEVDESLPAKNLNQLYTIKRQLANPAFTTVEPAEKPVPARPAQPRVHTALADLQRQRDKVQQIMDLKQEIETLTARAGRTRYGITPGLSADIEDIYPNPATEADMDAAIQGYEVQKKKLTDYIARQRKVFPKEDVAENFADGKGPGRPGDSQRYGIPKGATIAQLEKAAKAPGRKGQLARWQLNMRRGKKK